MFLGGLIQQQQHQEWGYTEMKIIGRRQHTNTWLLRISSIYVTDLLFPEHSIVFEYYTINLNSCLVKLFQNSTNSKHK